MKSAKKAVAKAAVARKKAAAKKKAGVARKGGGVRPKIAAVATARGDAQAAPHPALREEYTIEAQNFGPIAEAKLTLKPLTVLIGPSNTGKTYMAMLACMMLRKHLQYSSPSAQFKSFYTFLNTAAGKRDIRGVADAFIAAIDAGKNDIPMSHFPESFRGAVSRGNGKIHNTAWESFPDELVNCCGAESIANLVSNFRVRHPLSFEFTASVGGNRGAGTNLYISPKGAVSRTFKLADVSLPLGGASEFMGHRGIDEIRQIASGKSKLSLAEQTGLVAYMIRFLWFPMGPMSHETGPLAHFFPASRGGLMQARHAITIAILRAAGRGGLTEIPGIPALPMLSAEFLADIVRLTVQPQHGLSRNLRTMRPLVQMIEQDLLGGEIFVQRENGQRSISAELLVPQVRFKPDGVSAALTLAQSSSMVCEIAPLVLHMKAANQRSDVMFIEEPEAHLHPDAQTTMAKILAAMIRAGIRVVITTHSDWMLAAIANIVRRGELGEDGSEDATLTKEQVGVWLFDRGRKGAGVTTRELKFSDTGYIPDNLRDISDNLHNETADLLDAMDEKRSKAAAKKAK